MKKKLCLFPFCLLLSITLVAQDKLYDEWYLTTRDSVEIFVKEMKGGKDTVIVLHGGFGANHDYMLDAIKGLEKDFHFILYDQRGSLMSPASKEKLTFQKNVNDLYELVVALKLKKVKLLCHSMGTLVGMEFLKQHPEMVTNLVLCGALLPKADNSGSVFSPRVTSQLKFLTTRKSVNELRQPYNARKSSLTHKEKTEYWRINFAAGNIYQVEKWNLLKGGRSYYKQESSVMFGTVDWNYDYRSILDHNSKVTVIQGQFDFLDFDGETYKTLIKGFKNITCTIIPRAGHNSWIDEPEVFRENLRKGLSK